MKKLLMASHNKHKVQEVSKMLPEGYQLISLSDLNFTKPIPETSDRFDLNALQKACFVKELTQYDVFADDSGLEVEALDGRPGVFSSRYGGEEGNHQKNNEKLLKELNAEQNRKARFRTVIALIMQGKEYFFEGIVEGKIIEGYRGKQGFGYDPLFIPDGYEQTFAEMDLDLKNQISHRSRAIEKMMVFLKNCQG